MYKLLLGSLCLQRAIGTTGTEAPDAEAPLMIIIGLCS